MLGRISRGSGTSRLHYHRGWVRRVHGPGHLGNGRKAVVAFSVVGTIVAWLALTVTLAGAAPNGR